MNKEQMIFAAAGAVAGGVVGFAIGYFALKSKVTKDNDEKLERQFKQAHANEEALKDEIEELKHQKESDEEEYQELVEEYEPEEDDADILDEDGEEVEIAPADLKHRDPRVLRGDWTQGPWCDEDGDIDFNQEELWYYMSNELLVDEDGEVRNETDTIGNNLRRYGFLSGQGSSDEVWVRNYDQETDYLVHRCLAPDEEITEEEDTEDET